MSRLKNELSKKKLTMSANTTVDIPGIKTQSVAADQDTVISFGRVRLAIPAGAVTTATEITIEQLREVSELNPGLNNTTQGANGYRFKPDGIKFLKPVSVTIPYDRTIPREDLANLYTYFYNEDCQCWERLERVDVDTANATVTSLTTHFTDLINGVLTVPETAKPLNFNPTSIKEIKAADPGTGIDLINPPQAGSQGTAGLSYPLEIPPGRNGLQPQLTVQYNSDGGNGWLGLGWDLPLPNIAIDTRWGAPRYSDDNETETYLLNGLQLTPLAHRGVPEPRTAEKVFHTRVEGEFCRIIRHGDYPSDYWWEVTDKQGIRYFYGGTPEKGQKPAALLCDFFGVLESEEAEQDDDYMGWPWHVFKWFLTRVQDTNGNTIDYSYQSAWDTSKDDGGQLYLSKISYTGSNGVKGLYTINFIRDRELGEMQRSDVSIDGRPGFLVATADLLRKVEVKFQDQLIRSYEFQYEEGAFKKSLLRAIIQYGQDGTEFNRHEFTYYDQVRDGDAYNGFAAAATWDTGNDNITVDLPGSHGGASVLGSAQGNSRGRHLYVGVSLVTPEKATSAGFKAGSSETDNEDLVAFIDLNGDGLPDKIFKKDGQIWFRANNGPAEEPFFGDPVALNINTIGRETSSATSYGAEIYAGGGSVMMNTSHTITTSNIYFSDVNGDGLPDLVMNGKVYFNRLVDGIPNFVLDDSAGTPVPVSPATIDPNQLVRDFTAEYDAQLDASPLLDALRVWRAPFTGKVSITAPVRLMPLERDDYTTADGVRVAIQHNGSELWSASIGADDFTVHMPSGTGSLSVAKGDRIYFRVSSVFDGAFDQVTWDPEITYLNVPADLADANGLTPYHYQASQDFVCAGRSASIQVPISGTVRIDGDLAKTGATSDDIQLVVYQNDTAVISRGLTGDATGTIAMGDELSVSAGDKLALHVKSDSPIDLTKISWNPEIYYTAAVDPAIQITDADGNPSVRMPVLCGYDIYQPVSPSIAQGCWTATQTGMLTVVPSVSLSGTNIDGAIAFTVKKTNTLLGKETIAISGGQPQTPTPLTVSVTQGDKLYFDFCSRQQLDGKATVSVQVYYTLPDYQTVPGSFHCAIAPYPNSLPDMYRGWGYAAYNGNRDRYSQPINESELVVDSSYGNTALPKVFLMVPDGSTQQWVSQDEECRVSAETMRSSRLGSNYIALPQVTASSEGRAVNRIGSASQSTTSTGAFFATVSDATGASYSELDFLDMNGDGFPDIVSRNGICYSTPTGGLEDTLTTFYGWENGNGNIRNSDNHARMGGIGGNAPDMRTSAKGTVGNNFRAAVKRMMSPLGVSYNPLDEESTRATAELIDINGDGLPDQVWLDGDNIMVSLNLGYSFDYPLIWGSGAILETTGQNQPLTANPGFNDGIYGFAGGVNFNSSRSQVTRQFVDINGDGLPDLVISDGTTMHVAFNTGNGFAAPVEWRGAPARYIGETENNQRGGGLYFTYAFPIPNVGVPTWIIVNPGVDISWSLGRRQTALLDVTGDNCPDFVAAGDEGRIQVSINQVGTTNLLKSVSRPLGAGFEITYHREGNTYHLPQRKWVLDKVALNDGAGAAQLVTFRYSGGKFDRLEREFYGFSQVTAEHRDPADNSLLRSVVTNYHTNSYYTKGLIESVETRDEEGRLFLHTVNQYRLLNVDTGAELINAYPGNTIATVFPQFIRSDQYFHEGQSTAGVSAYQTYAYDGYGNVTGYFDAGEGGAADDLEAAITYYQDLTKYIVSKPRSTKVYANGALLRHREADYDAVGNQTQVRQYLTENKVRVTDFTYYANGNLQSVTGPANVNGERYAVTYEYDPVVGSHITKITDSFGYVSSAAYNYLYGVPIASTDINGNVLKTSYDNFGRVTGIFSPYDVDMPAVFFAYYPGEYPARAVTRNKLYFDPLDETAMDTVLFIDGLKRVIQTKKEAEVLLAGDTTPTYGMNVSGKTVFDALGRVSRQGQPVFETGYSPAFAVIDLKNPTLTAYDVLDRTTLATLPDNSTFRSAYSIEEGRFKTVVTDPEGKIKQTYHDVRGNIVKVVQFKGGTAITVTYGYDPLSQITTVTDAQGNETQISYDLLGRRTSINSPDRGLVEYTYDLAGNIVLKIDDDLRVKDEAIRYGYRYNRLEKIHYPASPDVEYCYGGPGAGHNQAGRVYQIIDATGKVEHFYGKLGETEKTVRTINFLLPGQEAWVFETETGYDYLGRVQWMSYPDGEKLHYEYDKGGAVKSAYGAKAFQRYDYVKEIAYDEFGQRVSIKYGNDVTTTYAYDPYRRWLAGINTQNSAGQIFQNTLYTFDKAANVLGINNAATGVTHSYSYDDLYQLVRAEGTSTAGSYSQDFDYDSIGNMVRKISSTTPGSNLIYDFTFLYQSGKPHASSQIGGWTYSYDANGNTVQKAQGEDITEYFWNEENRLLRAEINGESTDFAYDANGNRTVKRGPQGETLYVSEFYQIHNRDTVTKHIFVGPSRIASQLSRYHDPNLYDTGYERSHIYTYHPDHLGSSNIITDSAGNMFQQIEYMPYGETWLDEGTDLNVIGYKFTGKELDTETGLYYYGARYLDPQSSRWLSPDPALPQYLPEMQSDGRLPGMGGVFNPVNMQLYHYAANNPIQFIDPTGAYEFRAVDFDSDWAGRKILWWYLYGGGEERVLAADSEWSQYMKANPLLRERCYNIVIEQANQIPAGAIRNIDITTWMEVQNGESITGYNYLHGTNADVGGFRITGTIEKGISGTIVFDLTYQWNDKIDPNFEYISDRNKAKIAQYISFGRAKDYIIRISWADESVYIPDNYALSSGWLFDQ